MPAIDVPVGAFGATVAMAGSRLVDDPIPETLGEGQRGIDVTKAAQYVTEYDAHVQLALRDLPRLPEDAREPFRVRAQGVIADLAASAIYAARHPERASKASDSYSQFLADRARLALDQLAADVTAAVGELPSSSTGVGGAAASFPAPRVRDAQPW